MTRCPWCLMNEREIKYHDEEWGVPVHDDWKQFEYLMLEVMQCGLSWDTVLKNREIFRTCFDGFDFDKVAKYSNNDIERIMNTPGAIRSRREIEAVIGNVRCVRQIRKEFGSFSMKSQKAGILEMEKPDSCPPYPTLFLLRLLDRPK